MNQRLQLCRKISWNRIQSIGRRTAARLVCGFLLVSMVYIAACSKPPVKPSEITTNDVCFACKAPIREIPYAAEFITSNGFVRKFDDFSCMAANAKKVGKKNIVAFYAIDAGSQKLFRIDELQLLRSDKFVSPQKSGIIAFKDPERAGKIATQLNAEKIKLDDILK